MPNDTDQQAQARAKELEREKQERDAAISKATDEMKLVELQGQTAKAQAERLKALSDLEGQAAKTEAERQKALIELEGQTALAKATNQKALIDLEKQTAEAQRDAFAAQLPTSTVTPLAGETTLGPNAGYLAELVAYQAIRRAVQKAADDISLRLKEKAPKLRILIVSSLDLVSAKTAFDLIFSQVTNWQTMLHSRVTANESLLTLEVPGDSQGGAEETGEPLSPNATAPVAALALAGIGAVAGTAGSIITAAGSLAGAAASVAALFRNDYTVVGRELSFKQEVIQSQIAHALSKFDVTLQGFQPRVTSDLLVHLQNCFNSRIELATDVARLGARIDGRLSGANGAESETTKNALRDAMQESTALLTAWDQFVVGLTTASANVPSPLARALAAEELLDPDITHYLYVNVTSSNSETQTEKSLWRSGRVTYRGGGVLNYVLVERSGTIVAADAQVAMSTLTVDLRDEPAGLVDSLG